MTQSFDNRASFQTERRSPFGKLQHNSSFEQIKKKFIGAKIGQSIGTKSDLEMFAFRNPQGDKDLNLDKKFPSQINSLNNTPLLDKEDKGSTVVKSYKNQIRVLTHNIQENMFKLGQISQVIREARLQ